MHSSEETTRVLLVEDNPADAALINRCLQSNDLRYDVEEAASLTEALESPGTSSVDVILLDLSLPDSEGTATVEAMSKVCNQPIVVLTGSDSDDEGLECLAAGAHDYVPKSELSASRLRRAIGYALFRNREERLRELEAAMAKLRAMSWSGGSTPVTSALSGSLALEKRDPERFDELVRRYQAVLSEYLDHVVLERPRPREGIRSIASALGSSFASARDVIDIHLEALERSTEGATTSRRHAVSVDGRLLGLEVMGNLVDYYRASVRPTARPQESES